MLADEVEILRNIPIFAKIDRAKLKLLAFASERLRFEGGDYVVREGEMGDCCFVVMDGRGEVIVTTPQGSLKVAEIGKNDVVGEVAILCDVPRTASVRAITRIDTLRIEKDLFFSLLKEFPDIAIEVMRVLAYRLENITKIVREKVTPKEQALGQGEGV